MQKQFLRLNLAAASVEKGKQINEEFLNAIILILATGLHKLSTPGEYGGGKKQKEKHLFP